MASHKIEKIASDIAREISEILFSEARDPLLETITITGVDVSSDLYYAKVYFTCLTNLDIDYLEKEVNEAAPFVRNLLAERLDLRHTPELEFIFDKSVEYGNRIEKIIKEMHEKES